MSIFSHLISHPNQGDIFPNQRYLFYYKYLIPILIVLAVFLFNLPYLYTDALWQDDGVWYFKATEGLTLWNSPWRATISTLTPYLDFFYSYGMVYLGLPFTRGFFVFIMALCSMVLYFLYRDAFGIDYKVAVPAAVIPNILPSLQGIPVSLNASYAMWGMLPILISLIFILKAFTTRGVRSWTLIGFAFAFYAIGLNLTGSTNFLVPCVLLFFLAFFPTNKIKSFFYCLPFLVYGLWQIYKQYLYTHRVPTRIPFVEVMDRVGQFIEMASFLPFNHSYSSYITIGLMFFGILGLLSLSSMLYRQPIHFNYNRNVYRLLLIGWPLCWMVVNSIAYVAASRTFRVYDYAYVFNYGAVLLQVVGLVFLVVLFFRMPLSRMQMKINVVISGLVVCIILVTGIQRIYEYYEYNEWNWKTILEGNSKFIRENLSGITLPQGTQLLLLGMSSPHSGIFRVNSGYIRYLLNRSDLTALIGSNKYPNDIFTKPNRWQDHMQGFNREKPVVAFKRKGSTIERVRLLLQVVSTGRTQLPRLQWTLYDISTILEPPRKLASGKGMTSYHTYIQNDLPPELQGADIAFAPQGTQEEFINDARAEQITEEGGILDAEIKFGEHFILRNISAIAVKNGYELIVLVKVNTISDKIFRLGYRLNKKKVKPVNLWDYVIAGDQLLFTLPIVSATKIKEGISFELMNIGRWPFQPLVVQGGVYDQAKAINIRLTSEK